jgi:hypothetical protein
MMFLSKESIAGKVACWAFVFILLDSCIWFVCLVLDLLWGGGEVAEKGLFLVDLYVLEFLFVSVVAVYSMLVHI